MWRYRFLLFILFPPLALYTLWQSFRAFEFRYFLQRLAIFFPHKATKDGIWIHAASVGEVNAVIPLLIKIQNEFPELPLTITTNTVTSASVVKTQLPKTIQHHYFPLDYRYAVKRIIKKIKPKVVFIVETEFWPNLYLELDKQKIALNIINGRISEKTLHAKKWLKEIYSEILPRVTYVYSRSETDQSRFIELGLPEDKTQVLGNIKFSALSTEKIEPINLNRTYVLAASTRDDEEQLIVEAWVKAQHNEHLLVIVPRHPHRLAEILKQLSPFNLNIAVRSKKESVSDDTNIYIADTIGELKQFIAGSEFVLMGGSFVEKGGHNILEVAQLGKAVIFGPDMSNFMDEANIFIQYNAGIQCTLPALTDTFNDFLSDRHYTKTIENNTHSLILENDNIKKYLTCITEIITK